MLLVNVIKVIKGDKSNKQMCFQLVCIKTLSDVRFYFGTELLETSWKRVS